MGASAPEVAHDPERPCRERLKRWSKDDFKGCRHHRVYPIVTPGRMRAGHGAEWSGYPVPRSFRSRMTPRRAPASTQGKAQDGREPLAGVGVRPTLIGRL